jgi:hypothetical protein
MFNWFGQVFEATLAVLFAVLLVAKITILTSMPVWWVFVPIVVLAVAMLATYAGVFLLLMYQRYRRN